MHSYTFSAYTVVIKINTKQKVLILIKVSHQDALYPDNVYPDNDNNCDNNFCMLVTLILKRPKLFFMIKSIVLGFNKGFIYLYPYLNLPRSTKRARRVPHSHCHSS